MGPWIETDFDLDAAQTIVPVNGEEKIRFKTDSTIFGPAALISRMSQYLTLYPGDVVWMGTEARREISSTATRSTSRSPGSARSATRWCASARIRESPSGPYVATFRRKISMSGIAVLPVRWER
jgi:hypothetical protein